MYNYFDYEANLPTDRASYKVLYHDYFHDSLITAVNISPQRHSLKMLIQCRRDWETDTQNLRKDILDEKYGYLLTFSGVSHLEIHTSLEWCDYINGRFKAIPKGTYYFRIQTADGYMDIGYHGFRLRKRVGRVSYKGIPDPEPWRATSLPITEAPIAGIWKLLAEHGYTGEDEFALYLDLERLYASKAEGLAPYLRRIAASGWQSEDAVPFAAWLLGKFGDSGDIPLLRQLWGQATHPMIRKNLSDAIEALSQAAVKT